MGWITTDSRDVTLPVLHGCNQHPAFVIMICNLRYQVLTQKCSVVTETLQVIYTPVTALLLVLTLTWMAAHVYIRSQTTLAPHHTRSNCHCEGISRCKHSNRLFPSPYWILITNSDLGYEFAFLTIPRLPLPTKAYTTLVPKFFNSNCWFLGPINHPFLSKTHFFGIYEYLFVKVTRHFPMYAVFFHYF